MSGDQTWECCGNLTCDMLAMCQHPEACFAKSPPTDPNTTAALTAEYETYLSASHVSERQHERMIELSRLLGCGVFERAERADPQTMAKRCGSCAEYWSLEGDSILPQWSEPDCAGTCRWSTFRLFTDEPIMDCWSAKSHG